MLPPNSGRPISSSGLLLSRRRRVASARMKEVPVLSESPAEGSEEDARRGFVPVGDDLFVEGVDVLGDDEAEDEVEDDPESCPGLDLDL